MDTNEPNKCFEEFMTKLAKYVNNTIYDDFIVDMYNGKDDNYSETKYNQMTQNALQYYQSLDEQNKKRFIECVIKMIFS